MMEQKWSLNIGHCLQIDVTVSPKDFIIPGVYASQFNTFFFGFMLKNNT
jgi:hypothetical protein